MGQFVTRLTVDEHETSYLVKALVAEMPQKGEVIPVVYTSPSDFFIGDGLVIIVTPEPLTLAQRRFLTACGFQFKTVYEE